jgi:hypothetical protein
MLALLYHNILSVRAGGFPVAGHQVTIDEFHAQMTRLQQKLLHPLYVQGQLLQGKIPKGILITFDDGAAGMVKAGEVLAEMGTAGVVFICPGGISSRLWFYKLADALVQTKEPHLSWKDLELNLRNPLEKLAAYSPISKRLFSVPIALRDDFLAEIESKLGVSDRLPHPALRTMDETELEQAAKTGGLFFGNHSWSHHNLTVLSPSELEKEIEGAFQWLLSSGLPTLPWFAPPRNCNSAGISKAILRHHMAIFTGNGTDCFPNVPRVGIYDLDSNKIRFGLKTIAEGSLYFAIPRRRSCVS